MNKGKIFIKYWCDLHDGDLEQRKPYGTHCCEDNFDDLIVTMFRLGMVNAKFKEEMLYDVSIDLSYGHSL